MGVGGCRDHPHPRLAALTTPSPHPRRGGNAVAMLLIAAMVDGLAIAVPSPP